MSLTANVDWEKVLYATASHLEKKQNIKVDIDPHVVFDVGNMVNKSLDDIGLDNPNVAKIAGQLAFWIRKLKPLRLSPDSPNKLLTVNEHVALLVGLALCNKYRDDNSKEKPLRLPPRIFRDWLQSFRYHSHSPHSSMISFELLMCDE